MKLKKIIILLLSLLGVGLIFFIYSIFLSDSSSLSLSKLSFEDGVVDTVFFKQRYKEPELNLVSIEKKDDSKIVYHDAHPLVKSAKKQIGVVTKYDTSYYQGGYPPEDRGACTDVIERALRDNDYMLKEMLDKDMLKNPDKYFNDYDSNINFRRVKNLKVFLDRNADTLSICTSMECFSQDLWQAGDIVTYEQIPGGLWHVAIVSNKVRLKGTAAIPYLIHNHGYGVLENELLLSWPAPISGHYRVLLP